jgi:hypothetical protein
MASSPLRSFSRETVRAVSRHSFASRRYSSTVLLKANLRPIGMMMRRWPALFTTQSEAGHSTRPTETAYSSMAAAGSSCSTNRAHSWAISIKVARETPPGNIFASCKHARASCR